MLTYQCLRAVQLPKQLVCTINQSPTGASIPVSTFLKKALYVVNIEVKLLKYIISSTEQQNRGAMFSTATIRDAGGLMRGEGRSRDNQSGGKGEG